MTTTMPAPRDRLVQVCLACGAQLADRFTACPICRSLDLGLTDDEWDRRYKPLDAGGGSLAREYPETLHYDPHQVWSYIDGNAGATFIANGYHVVNAFAYVVTEEPWVDGQQITVVLDLPDEDED